MGRLLLLEDDDDLRESLAIALSMSQGAEICDYESYEALVTDRARALTCSAAILDVNLGRDAPTGIDAATWLRAQGFTGLILFLTGHAASYPAVARMSGEPGTSLVTKPVALDALTSLLREQAAAS